MISILCGILFRLGGVGRNDRFMPFLSPPTNIAHKLWRWLGIGLVIALYTQNPLYIATYYISTNIFGYGERHPLKLWLGNYAWYLYGFMFGLASFSIINAFIMGSVFYYLMMWSNYGLFPRHNLDLFDMTKQGWKLDHAYVEIIGGTVMTAVHMFR